MVEKVNNNSQLINEGFQVEEFADKSESKALSETVENLRQEANTATVTNTPKKPVIKNPDTKVDILESGDESLSLFEDDSPAVEQAKVPVQEPKKVVQEQRQIFTEKQEAGDFAKYDETAVSLASQYIDEQFKEDKNIETNLQGLGLLDAPEDEAANVIMQSAEILGEVETPESDTKMSFIEDVDALLMSRPQEETNLEEPVLHDSADKLNIPEAITEEPVEKPVVAKKVLRQHL